MAEMTEQPGQRQGRHCLVGAESESKQVRVHSKSGDWPKGRPGKQKGLKERQGSEWPRGARTEKERRQLVHRSLRRNRRQN